MDNFSRIGLMGLTLVLSGCGNDDVNFARLSFDHSVVDEDYRRDDNTIQQVYMDGLHQIFKEAGIAPEDVKIHFDEEKLDSSSLLLSTSEKKQMTEAQKVAVQNALEQILADKKRTMTVRFSLRPEEMKTDKKEYREEAARLNKEYTTELTVKDVMVGISYNMLDSLLMAMQGTKRNEGEAFCTVALTLSPVLPFSGLVVNDKDEQPVSTSLIRGHGYYAYTVPADIQLGDPHLQTKLDNSQIYLSTEITNSSQRYILRHNQGKRGLRQLEIELGSLGPVNHEYGKVTDYVSSSLDQKCRKMAAEFGRPFSFSMGDSLDRLSSVAFY
ncbi:hypothetical protein [Photobacterium sp. 1_MG-2023]|uniref:hypothetical protein n=1 Tax=Photobacterium sp. 1_MG-2023 TaxID=3062646 RepID=UPI0026E28D4A|nr:hypothetical protein [Photobacterium sp. 1_MG-2023]MDO6707577.1 hypothetical protein [Photobacterium sp. 1_MG-2023]